MDSTSQLARIIEMLSGLKHIGLFGSIFALAVTALVVAIIYYLYGLRKTPPCPKPHCGSGDVMEFDCPTEPVKRRHYRCLLCGHEWHEEFEQPRDLAETARTN